jgi:energy-converting hydrogenase Eha subunit H
MRLMPFLPLMSAVPMVAVINLYGFIIVLAMLTPAWLWAMSASVLEIRRTWREDQQQREVASGRLRIGRWLTIVVIAGFLLGLVAAGGL